MMFLFISFCVHVVLKHILPRYAVGRGKIQTEKNTHSDVFYWHSHSEKVARVILQLEHTSGGASVCLLLLLALQQIALRNNSWRLSYCLNQ